MILLMKKVSFLKEEKSPTKGPRESPVGPSQVWPKKPNCPATCRATSSRATSRHSLLQPPRVVHVAAKLSRPTIPRPITPSCVAHHGKPRHHVAEYGRPRTFHASAAPLNRSPTRQTVQPDAPALRRCCPPLAATFSPRNQQERATCPRGRKCTIQKPPRVPLLSEKNGILPTSQDTN